MKFCYVVYGKLRLNWLFNFSGSTYNLNMYMYSKILVCIDIFYACTCLNISWGWTSLISARLTAFLPADWYFLKLQHTNSFMLCSLTRPYISKIPGNISRSLKFHGLPHLPPYIYPVLMPPINYPICLKKLYCTFAGANCSGMISAHFYCEVETFHLMLNTYMWLLIQCNIYH